MSICSFKYKPSFDEKFFYKGRLGAIYSKDETTFVYWCPFFNDISLKLENNDGSFSFYKMDKGKKGEHKISVKGNLKNKKYAYVVNENEIIDPYALAFSYDNKFGIVVDLSNIKVKTRYEFKGKKNDAIIYETSVRDFTSFEGTNIEHKGKFLGLVEANRVTNENKKAGLDYLKSLGITHVQLLPIFDFARIKDDEKCKEYNWGYDPLSYFNFEGSYSINPKDPIKRIEEVKKMIDVLHENDIGVVIDVVYNHFFEFENSPFEKGCPGYYFRQTKTGEYSNASGCGNDLATERKMVRKLIIDSILYLVKYFDIDGLRFDLMGLIDINTIKEIETEVHKIKKSFLIYGEGWDMCYELKQKEKTIPSNASSILGVGFFNDTFRDLVKGNSFELKTKGYASGDFAYQDGLIYALFGSSIKHIYEPKFKKPSQSINYVECHDNYTIYDKYIISNPSEDTKQILRRVLLSNCLTLFSYGTSFIHMGQEYGATKYNEGNTYIAGDKYNQLDYALKDKRDVMVDTIIGAIKIKKTLPFLKLDNPNLIKSISNIEKLNNGVILYKVNNKKYLPNEYKEICFYINPSIYDYWLTKKDNMNLIFSTSLSEKNRNVIKDGIIPPLSFTIVGEK